MVERKLESYLSFLRSSKDTVTKNGLIQHLMPALDFVLPQSHETTTDIKFPRQYRSKKYDPGQNAIFPKVKNKKIQRVQAKHTDSLINQLILECKTSTVDSKCWLYILAAEPLDVFHHISVLHENEKSNFLENLEQARILWACTKCGVFNSETIDCAYYACKGCQNWYHDICSPDYTSGLPFLCELCQDFTTEPDLSMKND